jgi:hypothetical protein
MPTVSLWRRFHDEKGNPGITEPAHLLDAAYSLFTAVLRCTVGYRPCRPWIVRRAWKAILPHIGPHSKVFEWGGGMSTLWYESHAGEVHAVEDNPAWYAWISRKTVKARVYFASGDEYVDKIKVFPDRHFDLISVDGANRHKCFRAALRKLKPGGYLIVDNTDKDRHGGDLLDVDKAIDQLAGYTVSRHTGWAPGVFFPQETTICIKHRDT